MKTCKPQFATAPFFSIWILAKCPAYRLAVGMEINSKTSKNTAKIAQKADIDKINVI